MMLYRCPSYHRDILSRVIVRVVGALCVAGVFALIRWLT